MTTYPIPAVKFEKYVEEEKKSNRPKIHPPQKYEEGIEIKENMKDILLKSFVMLMLGKPGSGKTSLLSQLLTREEFFAGKFDRILYVTPTDIPGITHDEEINTCRSLDTKWIYKKIKECSEWCENLLIVFDDVVADIPPTQRNELKTIFYDRRHLLPKGCISIIVTTQKYSCAPMWLRVCINMFISFGIQPNEVKSISIELNTGKEKKMLDHIYRHLKKHHFLIFNLEEGVTYDHEFNRI